MESTQLLKILEQRFISHIHRHPDVSWKSIQARLTPQLLDSLVYMEQTKGEPDVLLIGTELWYCDFSKETPKRPSLCYDKEARLARKKFPPASSAVEDANFHHLHLVTESEYLFMQNLEDLDCKTSSWIFTEPAIREKGGALFGSKRYDRTFIYCNGADSYYSSRGYRAKVKL